MTTITPQLLHDAWLIINVILLLEIVGIGLYLWQMGGRARKFLRMTALAFFSIAGTIIGAEFKNVWQQEPPPVSVGVIAFWLLTYCQAAIVLGFVLGYLVFGRNGDPSLSKAA
jgi:hypothetical protein